MSDERVEEEKLKVIHTVRSALWECVTLCALLYCVEDHSRDVFDTQSDASYSVITINTAEIVFFPPSCGAYVIKVYYFRKQH